MNTNVSEELVNNEGLLNWTIDRTNNISPDSIPSYEVLERVYERVYVPQRPPVRRYLPPQGSVGSIQIMRRTHDIQLISSYYHYVSINGIKFDISIVIEEAKEQEFDCPICFELSKAESKITLNCGHTFCGKCIKETLTRCNARTPTCALCRTNVSSFKVPNKEIHDLVAPHCNNVV